MKEFNLLAEDFDSLVIESSKTQAVLVQFTADWCVPCKELSEKITSLIRKFGDSIHYFEVDVEIAQDIASFYHVESLPCVKLFENGRVSDDFVGNKSISFLARFLSRLNPDENIQKINYASERFKKGDLLGAFKVFKEVFYQPTPVHLNHENIYDGVKCAISLSQFKKAELWLRALKVCAEDKAQYENLNSFLSFCNKDKKVKNYLLCGDMEGVSRYFIQSLSPKKDNEENLKIKKGAMATFSMIEEDSVREKLQKELSRIKL